LVTILYATPIAAVIASSRIIGIGISVSVANPTNAVTSAIVPGIRRPVNERRAAVIVSTPVHTSLAM